MQPYVYILASERNGTLYIEVTSDLVKRIWQQKNDAADGFTKKYQVHHLVCYEDMARWNLRSSAEKHSRTGIASGNYASSNS